MSIRSLLSQVTMGALLLGFFVCFRWPVLFGIGICSCGLSDTVVFSSGNKTFCASFFLYYFVVVPSLKNTYCSLCICLLYIWLFPVSCWCTCVRLLGVYLRMVLLGHWVFEWDFTWLYMSDIFCICGLGHTLIIFLGVYLGALSPSTHRNCVSHWGEGPSITDFWFFIAWHIAW